MIEHATGRPSTVDGDSGKSTVDKHTARERWAKDPPRSRISRAGWHFIVDCVLLGFLLSLAWLQTMLLYVFPVPTDAAGWTLWGLDYNTWSTISFFNLVFFILATLVHLILQWNWIFNFIVRRLPWRANVKTMPPLATRTLYGVSTLIGVLTALGVLLAIAYLSVIPPSG